VRASDTLSWTSVSIVLLQTFVSENFFKGHASTYNLSIFMVAFSSPCAPTFPLFIYFIFLFFWTDFVIFTAGRKHLSQTNTRVLGSLIPVLGMKVEQWNIVIWSFIKVNLSTAWSVRGLVYSSQLICILNICEKNNRITFFLCFTFTPVTGMGLL